VRGKRGEESGEKEESGRKGMNPTKEIKASPGPPRCRNKPGTRNRQPALKISRQGGGKGGVEWVNEGKESNPRGSARVGMEIRREREGVEKWGWSGTSRNTAREKKKRGNKKKREVGAHAASQLVHSKLGGGGGVGSPR